MFSDAKKAGPKLALAWELAAPLVVDALNDVWIAVSDEYAQEQYWAAISIVAMWSMLIWDMLEEWIGNLVNIYMWAVQMLVGSYSIATGSQYCYAAEPWTLEASDDDSVSESIPGELLTIEYGEVIAAVKSLEDEQLVIQTDIDETIKSLEASKLAVEARLNKPVKKGFAGEPKTLRGTVV